MRPLYLSVSFLLISCSTSPARETTEEITLHGTLCKRNYSLGGHALSHGAVVDLDNPVLVSGKADPLTYVAILVYPAQEQAVQDMMGKPVELRCRLASPRESGHMYQVVFCPSTRLTSP